MKTRDFVYTTAEQAFREAIKVLAATEHIGIRISTHVCYGRDK